MKKKSVFFILIAIAFSVFQLSKSGVFSKFKKKQSGIQLCEYCPPGFELTDDNKCRLVTPYQQYSSLRGKGVGGLQTALPPVRDGFSPQQIDLGRYLFFDPVLSADKTISCASCHQPQLGLSDGMAQSVGIHHARLNRSAPTLWNVGFLQSFFWDARAKTLEEQMSGPLFAHNEMGTTPEKLLATLNGIEEYNRLFDVAFPDRKENKITLHEVCTAIAAFESSLISLNSRYDQYVHGYHEALSKKEIEGFNVFRSFVARCSECHTPPLFTNQQVAVIGVPEAEGIPFDIGAEKTFGDSSLRAGFKVPTLRNIEKTAPYMHSGVFGTLRESVDFYNKGRGHAVPKGQHLKLHWHIWEPKLTDYEIDRIVDFMKTLTDESFTPQVPKILPSGIQIHHSSTALNTNH